jgi:hypothetical protein
MLSRLQAQVCGVARLATQSLVMHPVSKVPCATHAWQHRPHHDDRTDVVPAAIADRIFPVGRHVAPALCVLRHEYPVDL